MRVFINPTWVAAIALLGVIILNPLSCKPSDPFVTTPVSGPIAIDATEQEIVFKDPYTPDKQVIKMCFGYTADLNAFPISQLPAFPDGTRLDIKASIIAQDGRTYTLTHVANSVDNYFCISPELTSEWMNIYKDKVAFVKLVIRTNRRIDFSRIEWVQYNSWDFQ